jgi:acyl carrier protein
VLNIEAKFISIDSNFFEIGGNSIKIIELNMSLNEALKKEIAVVKLFAYPTIRSFSNYILNEEPKLMSGSDRSEILENRRMKISGRRS